MAINRFCFKHYPSSCQLLEQPETSCPADDGVIEVEPFAQLQRLGAWGYYHLTAGEGRSCLAKGIHWWLQWWCSRLRWVAMVVDILNWWMWIRMWIIDSLGESACWNYWNRATAECLTVANELVEATSNLKLLGSKPWAKKRVGAGWLEISGDNLQW